MTDSWADMREEQVKQEMQEDKLHAEIERLRAALEQLLDAHWPLVESADHEDENCRRARSALCR